MIIEITKKYPHTPFAVKTEEVDNGPGVWNSTKVSIFRDGNMIGEYIRNYIDNAVDTFYPFEMNGEWYALYSSHYTTIRVMKIHNDHIEDWCGEDPNPEGFCPSEFYVPSYIHYGYKVGDQEYNSYTADCDVTPDEFNAALTNNSATLNYRDTAFVSGCVWGDDASWKLRIIDLYHVPQKLLTIHETFGYWELPDGLKLKECISLKSWIPDNGFVRVLRAESFCIKPNEIG